MEKTLGGDRLGSGNKMKVQMHGYERSTHNMDYIWRSTMAAGTLVPFMSKVALPGDTFDINLGCEIMTHPTIGPLFGSYKVQLDVFQAPIRLYNSLLHNNALGIGLNMDKVKLPVIEMKVAGSSLAFDLLTPDNIDNSQINPSSLLSYLGIRGVGINSEAGQKTRTFNAVPILAYWDIVKNYYANKQEEIGAVLHTPSETLVETVDSINVVDSGGGGATVPESPGYGTIYLSYGYTIEIAFTGTEPIPEQIIFTTDQGDKSARDCATGWTVIGGVLVGNSSRIITINSWRYRDSTDVNTGLPAIVTFPLENIDDMRKAILAHSSETVPFNIVTPNKQPYTFLPGVGPLGNNVLSSQEGLALKTYQSDLLQNWLKTDWIEGAGSISAVTAIDTSGGSFTIDTLNLSKKVYNMLNRIAVSGGTYRDWMDAVYDQSGYHVAETPMYMGGLIKELVFQEVVSNSASTDQPLGTLAGRGKLTQKHKGGNIVIRVDEPSYIIGIISLTPRLDYSQGNNWDINLQTLNDLHKPALDEIGFEDSINEYRAWWTTNYDVITDSWIQTSAGKVPAWMNYRTSLNETRGNFAIKDNEMFMTLNRRYEAEKTGINWNIQDLTTYIDPSLYNFIFAQTSLDSQNFWAQIAINMTTRRKMSARLMPNL